MQTQLSQKDRAYTSVQPLESKLAMRISSRVYLSVLCSLLREAAFSYISTFGKFTEYFTMVESANITCVYVAWTLIISFRGECWYKISVLPWADVQLIMLTR